MSVPSTVPEPVSDTTRKIMKAVAPRFAERGYSAVGMAEICSVSGYGKGALYHHIGSKDALLYTIMTVYLHDLLEKACHIVETVPDTGGRVRALSLDLLTAVVENNAEMTVCFREVPALSHETRRAVLRLHGDYYRVWEKVINAARDSREMRAIDPDELKALLGMYFYSFLWISPDRIGDIEALTDKFVSLVLRACSLD